MTVPPVRRVASRTVPLAVVLLAAAFAAVHAAPVIQEVGLMSPVRVQAGDSLLIMASPVDATATALFWNGTSSSLPGAVLAVDPDRGLLAVRVPAGAQSGPMVLSVGGAAAAPYHVGIIPGAFDGGSVPVGGKVLGPGGAPVAGAFVALLLPGCDNMKLWDAGVTDATGAFALTAAPGPYQLMAMSPRATQFYTTGAFVEAVAQPVAQDLETGPGVPATGRIVDGTDGTTPVAGALVSFDGQGHEQAFTGADGRFAVTLVPGVWEGEVKPPRGTRFRPREDDGIVIPAAPYDFGDVPLARDGVRVSGVLRAPWGEVLPGAQIQAVADNPCCATYHGFDTFGDGSYAVTLPPNATYHLRALLGEEAVFVDAMAAITVGAVDTVQDLTSVRAAYVVGTVRDRASGGTLGNVQTYAHLKTDTATVAWTPSCPDGSYRLRVPPASDLVVGAVHESEPYVPVAWNGTAYGTPFLCEGSVVRLASAGASTTIDFGLTRAATLAGSFRSQDSGCTALTPGSFVVVDDGAAHACGLGRQQGVPNPTAYTITHLPPLSLLPGLRACVSAPGTAPQCWNLDRPPAYDPLALAEGETRSGVDFCLGTQPTGELHNLRAGRIGGTVHFTWDPSSDLYHDTYALRGAQLVGGPYEPVATTTEPWADLPTSLPHRFFLVRDRGATGSEGP